MRQLDANGIAFIKSFEALRLEAYDDATGQTLPAGAKAVGTATIGWGHTKGVAGGQQCTAEQAEAWLAEDLAPAAQAVEANISVPLNDNQFAALTSFTFNVGAAAFRGSTLRKMLNDGRYAGVPAQLARWNKAGGKPVAGLTRRRAAEALLWATPVAGAPPEAPIPAADPPFRFAHFITLGGITVGAVSTALSDCAQQLQPLTDYSGLIKNAFLIVALAAAGLAMAARLKTLKHEGV